MNTNIGLIGKKLGNTQVFLDDGSVAQVTAVQVGPCTVVGKRTNEKDGYSALILGLGSKRDKLVNKPEAGLFKKVGQQPARVVRELRLSEEDCAKYEVGQVLKPSEQFEVGQKVDISGVSKGRGFTGVIKRWNMAGAGTVGHGTHEYKRHGGSIGCNLTPGRTLRNKKMAGQYGNKRMTILNLEVVKIVDDSMILLVRGGVPGSRNGIVTVRRTVKSAPQAA
jgi:large subunit ribosomal protein L3